MSIDPAALPFVVGTGAFVVVLLAAHARGARRIAAVAKTLASLCFVGAALAAGAHASAPGRVVVAGLVFSLVGDVLLVPKGSKRAFLGGLAAFLLAHLCYAASFLLRGVDVVAALAALAALAVAAVAVWRWLRARVSSSMRAPVLFYVGAITAMLALAVGAARRGAPAALLVAAALFYLSDLAVARERFVREGIENRLVGNPLYYAAQVLFALHAA